jgi:multiple sugar transport system substrate-binding protein
MQGKKMGTDLTRKDFLKLGGAGLAGAALLGTAGCGGSSGSGDLILSWGPDETGSLPKLVKQFNQQSKDFKVTYQEMPVDTGQYFDKLRTQFQAGGGDIDLILGDVIWPAQFAVNGWIVDLSDRFKDTDAFLSGPMQSSTYEGKVWAVPWYTDAGLLYYRQDLLEKSGYSEPPATWTELQEMAAKVMKDQGIDNGFVFQGDEYEGGVCNGCEYIWSAGGNILDPDDPSKVIIDTPEAAAGLAIERSMIETGTSPQAVLQYQESETEGAFLTGTAVFMRIWPSTYALAGTKDFPDVKKSQLGIAPIPVDEPGDASYSTLGGWSFMINAQSDLQEEAWEFIKFMTAPEQLITNAKVGSKLPVRKSLYEDPEVLDNVPVARLGKEAIIDNSRPRPVSPYYSDVSLELAEQLNASLSGDISPEDAVATLQEDLQQIVDQGEEAAG